MSASQTLTHEAPIASHATEQGSFSTNEILPPASLELQFPNATQYDNFDTIMRCDAALNPEYRLVDPVLARDVLLEKLKRASDIRARANACNSKDFITEQARLEAYCDGADALAGIMTLGPTLDSDNETALEALYEWSRLAVSAVTQAETRGAAPSTTIFLTPAALASDWSSKSVVRDALSERARFERTKQYWAAAQQHDVTKIGEAFVGGDATILHRAKALFGYAHTLPDNENELKVSCLEESVTVIHDAVTNGVRPHEDDLVGIYEYFMLQSMLGRSIHDIVWLDGRDTEEDDHVRSLSVQYLMNAANALGFVRDNLITAQAEPEQALRRDSYEFDADVRGDKGLNDARKTIDFLTGGLAELRKAEGSLLNFSNDPFDHYQKDVELDVAEKRVAYLQAKAELEQLEPGIAKQLDILRTRLDAIRAEHSSITERLLARRLKLIGDVLPGTYGHHLAELVLDIDQQINDARYFATLYESECRDGAQHAYELRQQLGLSMLRLFEMLEGIGPDDAPMEASAYRIPDSAPLLTSVAA